MTYRDVLVVDLLGGLGDLVILLPALHGLAAQHPGAAVRVLTHRPGADLLASDPAVTEVVWPDDDGPGAARRAVERELARRVPDLAVTTTRYDGIPALLEAAVPRTVTDLWRRPPPDEPVGLRYQRILRDEGLLATITTTARLHLRADELRQGERDVAALLPLGDRPPVVLVPAAGMAVKHWPTAAWAALAAGLADRGVPVLVSAERPDAGPPGAPVLPPAPLRAMAARFAAVGRRGGVVVGPDTGPVRVAAAVGAAVVGLFGPTAAARYGFDPVHAVDLQGLRACPHRRPTAITEQVCWWDATCPLSATGPACMADLAPDRVLRAVLGRLGGQDRLTVAASSRWSPTGSDRTSGADAWS